jgi:hypothetical protein
VIQLVTGGRLGHALRGSQARHVQLGEQLVKAKGVLVEAFGGSQLRLFACRDTLESFDA